MSNALSDFPPFLALITPYGLGFVAFVAVAILVDAIFSNQQSGDVVLSRPQSAARRRVTMTKMTRRTALVAGAASLFAGPAIAASSEPVDPVVAEARRLDGMHRHILTEWEKVTTLEEENDLKARIEVSGFDRDVDCLYATQPTTAAGIVALLDFVMAYEGTDGRELDVNIAHTILTTLRNAAASLTKGGVA